jgi:recombination associated protein RdgC
VNQKLDQRVQTIEVKDGRKLRRKEKQEMKEDLIAELLPKAFSKSSWTRAYIDTHRQLLVVASGSANKSDEITALLREDVGSLPVLPANPDSSPALHFTDWVSNGSQPKQFELGGACSLTSPEEQGMSIRCKGSENLNDAVHMHIEDGLLVNKLDLVWEERLAFSVDESCRLGGIKMLDAALDSLGDTEGDLADRFASEFHVFSSDMRTLFDDLMAALGNEPEKPVDASSDTAADPAETDSETPSEDEVPESEKAPF